MTRTRSMDSVLKPLPQTLFDSPIFLSGSSNESSSDSQQSTLIKRCCPAPNPTYSSKKPHTTSLKSFPLEDMHKFWICSQKDKFSAFKNYSIVRGRIINLCQLKNTFCNISHFFKFQDFFLVFYLCGFVVYKDPIRMFMQIYLFGFVVYKESSWTIFWSIRFLIPNSLVWFLLLIVPGLKIFK